MGILYFLVGISAVGVAAVFWLIKNEQNSEGTPLKNLEVGAGAILPASASSQGPKRLLSIFDKLGFGKKGKKPSEAEATQPSPAFALGNLFAKGQKNNEDPLAKGFVPSPEGGPSLKEPIGEEIKLSVDEEKKIEREIELMAQLDEIKEQNKNLDKLFKEKSAALEKAEESLENELRNRKEFNKLKDILEKELKEAKDRSRELQIELGATKAETEGYQKRIDLLEGKVTELEKKVLQRDDELANLTKRLQVFASPSTAAVPPQAEAPQDGASVLSPQPPAQSGEGSDPMELDLGRPKEERPDPKEGPENGNQNT